MVDEAVQDQGDGVQDVADARTALLADRAQDVAQGLVDHAADGTGGSSAQHLERLVGTGVDMAAQLRAARHRTLELVGRGAGAAYRDAGGVQATVDRHLHGAAELVGSGGTAQHLAQIDAVGVALEVDRQRRLAAVDHAGKRQRSAIEAALEVRDGQHAVLEGGREVGVADAQRGADQGSRHQLERAVDAAQRRRVDRLGAGGRLPARRRTRRDATAAADLVQVEHAGPQFGGDVGLARQFGIDRALDRLAVQHDTALVGRRLRRAA